MGRPGTGSRRPSRPVGRVLLLLGGLALFGLLLAAGGFAFAATQEQRDPFCASCHTQPESAFFDRENASQPVDLASAHQVGHKTDTRCIDCHSGSGVTGRVHAELLGAHNALLWYARTAVQPAVLNYPIMDDNCLKCHQTVIKSRTQNNHFHYFLSQWQAMDSKAATCVSCHGGHTTAGSAQLIFIDQAAAQRVCQACHAAAGRG